MHHIQQHILTINTANQSLGQEINAQISSIINADFYPKLEILLDEYSFLDKTIKIPVMNIELQGITPQNWKQEIVQQSLHEIEKQLKSIFFSLQHQEKFAHQLPEVKKEEKQIFNDKNNTLKFSLKTNREELSSIFLHYLQTGLLKENALVKTLPELWQKVEKLRDLLYEIAIKIISSPFLMKRWIVNVPELVKQDFIPQFPNYSSGFKMHEENLKSILKNYSTYDFKTILQLSKVLFWSFIFKEIKQNKIIEIEEILKSVEQKITNFLKNKTEFTNLLNEENLLLQIFESDIKTETIIHDSRENNPLEFEKYYIENAGLVIFNPFLQEFFKTCGLMKNQEFTNKKSQERGVLLTHYLVFENEKVFENELIFNKIICGMKLTDTLNTEFKITDEEKKNCQELWEAIANHWQKLKGTSIETIRESFFIRKGILEQNNTNIFTLKVENQSIDLLLNYLPWGISMIQLPWMECNVNCEWR